jgi:IclR family KDG regulon transcriptional repressor
MAVRAREQASRTSEGAPAERRSASQRLLAMLEALTEFDSVGVTEIARRLGIPAANAYRMLKDLEREGFVEQSPETKRYRLTLKVFEIGAAVANRITVRDVAAIEMEKLARELGVAVNLGVLVGTEVLYLEKIQTDDTLVLNLPPGTRAPAHCTAMGKAILAFDSVDPKSVMGPGPYPACTPNSVTSFQEMERELGEIRQLGYAVDRQELSLGIWCVGAPIRSPKMDVLGAVSITLFRPSLDDEELARLGPMVMMTAKRIGARTGNLAFRNLR